tara:strand:- start:374 stop:589 length:216 start_codon:yes stop_codon:yes gene_type:complete
LPRFKKTDLGFLRGVGYGVGEGGANGERLRRWFQERVSGEGFRGGFQGVISIQISMTLLASSLEDARGSPQ